MTSILDPTGTRPRDIVACEADESEGATSVTFTPRPQASAIVALVSTTWVTAYRITAVAASLTVSLSTPAPAGGGTVRCAMFYA